MIGAVAIGLLSVALSQLSHAPKIVIVFGLLAGAVAGSQVWTSLRGDR